MPSSAMGLGLNLHGGFRNENPLVSIDDSRDKRIKFQLERTGLEYLVVRRYQDPVGSALKRLEVINGKDGNRRIPGQGRRSMGDSSGSAGRYGLSTSLRTSGTGTANGSFEGDGAGSGAASRVGEDGSVSAILRAMWDKSFEFGASAD